jgi:hypothetical protein
MENEGVSSFVDRLRLILTGNALPCGWSHQSRSAHAASRKRGILCYSCFSGDRSSRDIMLMLDRPILPGYKMENE